MKKILFLIMILLAFPLVNSAEQQTLWEDSCVNYLPQDNLTGESSPNTFTATVAGGVSYETGVKQVGEASAFFQRTTNNPIQFPSAGCIASLKNLTIKFWSNMTEGGVQGVQGVVSTRGVGTQAGDFAILFNTIAGTEIIQSKYFYDGSNAITANINPATDFFNNHDFEEITFEVNYTGGVVYIYLSINNTVMASSSISLAPTGTNEPLTIGDTAQGDFGEQLFGGIDQFTLWDRLLTDSEDDVMHTRGSAGLDLEPETADILAPTIDVLNISNSTPDINDLITLTTVSSDSGDGVVKIIYANNVSGTMTNISTHTFINESIATAYENHTVVLGNILWTVTALDYLNNSVQGNIQYNTTGDITPPSILFISNNDSLTNKNPSFILLNATDNIEDNNITCIVSNSSNIFSELTQIQGTLFNLTFNPSGTELDQTFNLNISCYDNSLVNNSIQELYIVVLDEINPFDDLTSVIISGVKIFQDTNYTITAHNTNLFGHNLSVYNSSGSLVLSQEVLNISLPDHSLLLQINVTALGVGIFTVNSSESDDHTSKRIKDYNIGQDINQRKLSFDTGKANIEIQITEAVKILNDNARVSIINTLSSMGANKKVDRYNFEYNFIPDTTNVKSYEFKILVTSDKKVYHRITDYKGHLVIGNDHWIDFEGLSITDVSVSQISENVYEFIIYSTTSELVFESIGGVNFGSSISTFEIVAPSITSFRCNDGSCTGFTENDILSNVSLTCTEGESATMSLTASSSIFSNNNTVKLGNNYSFNNDDLILSPITYNISGICTNDIALSSSHSLFTVSTITVDTSPSGISTIVSVVGGLAILIVVIIILTKQIRLRRKK